jgi:hypothetical protein
MNIRRILLGFINAVMIFSLAARAQQSPAPAGDSAPAAAKAQDDQNEPARQAQARRQSALAQYLNLTESQKWQFVQIQRETTQKVRVARKDDSLSEEQMQQKLKEIHDEQRQRLIALLTTQQQDTLKKWWEEQKQKQQDKNSQTTGQVAVQDKDKSSPSDDDLFAGMVQDPEPPARTTPQKKKQ